MRPYDRNFGGGASGGRQMGGFRGGYAGSGRGYDRGIAPRTGRGYDRQPGGGRGYDRAFEGGWGMTGLFNEVMRGGPRPRSRYDGEIRTRPLGRDRGSARFEGRRPVDHDTVGVHLRGRYDRF